VQLVLAVAVLVGLHGTRQPVTPVGGCASLSPNGIENCSKQFFLFGE